MEKRREARRFGLFMAVACGLFGGIGWWQMSTNKLGMLFIGVGLLFVVSSLICPNFLIPLNKAWLNFGDLLHRIVSPIVLAAIFFGIITPIAYVMRFLGKDILSLRKNADSPSYWIKRSQSAENPLSMTQQF
tara:strand:- start:232 stop:627 length:396 start_codon:yes stop_codon:yes gene_type:complete